MWLARTAIIELSDPPPLQLGRHDFKAANGCVVSVISIGGAEEFAESSLDASRVLWPYESDSATVAVSVTLGVEPPELIAGRLRVPPAPRERAEAAIDEYADFVAITNQCRRKVRSPMAACVAVAPATDTERAAITGITEMYADHQAHPMPRVLPTMAAGALQRLLEDRPDAVALLADALSEPSATARVREFFRLFERAFAKGSTKLVDPLTAFLVSHPRHDALRYGRDEVVHWLTTLRPEIVHGDKRHVLPRAGDVEPYLGRLEVAVYDVVLNKANWHRSDSARRHGQPLLTGVQSDRLGVVLLDPRAAMRTGWRDWVGKYPTDWSARVALGPEWIWASPGQRVNFEREKLVKAGWDLH
jgi:hypothetical protein